MNGIYQPPKSAYISANGIYTSVPSGVANAAQHAMAAAIANWNTIFCHALRPRLCFLMTLMKSSRNPTSPKAAITITITAVSILMPPIMNTVSAADIIMATPPILGVPAFA